MQIINRMLIFFFHFLAKQSQNNVHMKSTLKTLTRNLPLALVDMGVSKNRDNLNDTEVGN